jgi:glutamate carboxypeptidase
MEPETANRIQKCVEAQFPEQVDYLRQLVRAESPSLDPESQKVMFDLLSQPLLELGYRVRRHPGRRSGGQLFARPGWHRRGAPCQLLLGHSDTVWPLGTLPRMPLVAEGNVMRGPGVYDMKAGLSSMVFALRALENAGIRPEVSPVCLVTSDEELASDDSRRLIQLLARRVDRVLVPEPAAGEEGSLKTSRKGVGLFTVSIHGRSAHAGVEPEAGISAVLEISHVIQELHSLNSPSRGISVTVGVVEGGTRSNVIPDFARALVDVRTRTLQDGEEIAARIRSIRPSRPGIRIEIEGGLDRPPLEPTPANLALWERARSLGHLLNAELTHCESGGGSDGNFTSRFTATLDGLGGVGGGAHAVHEFIYLDKLKERTALLALLIASPPIGCR